MEGRRGEEMVGGQGREGVEKGGNTRTYRTVSALVCRRGTKDSEEGKANKTFKIKIHVCYDFVS